MSRKYFEVFGDTLAQNSFLKHTVLLLVCLLIFMTIIVKTSMVKPPLVIRVDGLGNAEAFKNIKNLQNVTPVEISNFTQYFMQYFTSYNFYTYDEDFTRAFKMMTPACMQKMNDRLTTNQIVESIKNNQFKTKLKIGEIITVKDSPQYINLKVKGTKEIRSYQNSDFYREEIFEDELSIKKVPRTEKTPWGLLVDSWNESLYKR